MIGYYHLQYEVVPYYGTITVPGEVLLIGLYRYPRIHVFQLELGKRLLLPQFLGV